MNYDKDSYIIQEFKKKCGNCRHCHNNQPLKPVAVLICGDKFVNENGLCKNWEGK